jgi:hypothetical protein
VDGEQKGKVGALEWLSILSLYIVIVLLRVGNYLSIGEEQEEDGARWVQSLQCLL